MVHILIVFQASKEIGLGHYYRCLTIGKHLSSKGINPIYLVDSNFARAEIIDLNFRCYRNISIRTIQSIVDEFKVKVVIVDLKNIVSAADGYHYSFLTKLKKLNLFVISFDDYLCNDTVSDLVVIPYVGVNSKSFIRSKKYYLVGPEFFPIRTEFMIRKKGKFQVGVTDILISMGGSDPKNLTRKVLKSILKVKTDILFTIVIGSFSKHNIKLIDELLKISNLNYKLVLNPKNMAKLMSESQIGITSSGLTKYEMAFMGLPAITMSNELNEEPIMADFAKFGTIIHLGCYKMVDRNLIENTVIKLIKDSNKRKKMSRIGKDLIDGYGIERLFDRIPIDNLYA